MKGEGGEGVRMSVCRCLAALALFLFLLNEWRRGDASILAPTFFGIWIILVGSKKLMVIPYPDVSLARLGSSLHLDCQ